jgi:hypothetical protein
LLEKHQDAGKIPVGCDPELGRQAARFTISSLAQTPQGGCELAGTAQGNLAGNRRESNTEKATQKRRPGGRLLCSPRFKGLKVVVGPEQEADLVQRI